MKKGTTQALVMDLDVDLSLVNQIIFTLKGIRGEMIQKHYPADTTVRNGKVYLMLSQAETERFSGDILIEGQINFTDGSVGKTEIVKKNVEGTLFTQIVAGSTPSIENSETVSLALDGDVVLVNGGGGGVYVPIPTTPTADTLLLSWTNDAELPNPEPVTIIAPTGARGAKGDKGEAGAQGVQGIPGIKGDKGEAGSQGTQGLRGLQGATGSQGVQGIPGTKGDTGAKGSDGEQGLEGVQGIAGIKGDTGDTGAQGAAGAQGLRGEKGDDYILTEQDKIDIAAIIGVEFPINTTLAAVLGGGS